MFRFRSYHNSAVGSIRPSHLQKITELADRVFYIYGEQTRGRAKSDVKMPGAQATLEAYS
jgi:hypothetical protein